MKNNILGERKLTKDEFKEYCEENKLDCIKYELKDCTEKYVVIKLENGQVMDEVTKIKDECKVYIFKCETQSRVNLLYFEKDDDDEN